MDTDWLDDGHYIKQYFIASAKFYIPANNLWYAMFLDLPTQILPDIILNNWLIWIPPILGGDVISP